LRDAALGYIRVDALRKIARAFIPVGEGIRPEDV
jgi:hypothetical protein